MPTTAAAALSNTAREIGLSPRMSVTECMTSVSPSPMNGPNGRRPDALGETISFGHPDRQAGDGGGAEEGPLGAAEAEHAVDRPLLPEPVDHRSHSHLHLLHRRAARARRAHRPPARCPAASATSARDTSGTQPDGSPRIPESITTGLSAERAHALAHVRDLLALRVERRHAARSAAMSLKRSDPPTRPPSSAGRSSPARTGRRARAGTVPVPWSRRNCSMPCVPSLSDASVISVRCEMRLRSTVATNSTVTQPS